MLDLNCNRLFASLSSSNRERLLALAEPVDLPVRTSFYQPGSRPEHVILLTSGFASQVITVGGGKGIEVGLISSEGVVGHAAFLGDAPAPDHCFMQSNGAGYRLAFDALFQIFRSEPEVRTRFLEFFQEHTITVSFLATCNKLHEAEPRLARWLLMVGDRLQADEFPLTQEFLAQMLGIRRMTVTSAASQLQRSGVIEYKRGVVRILNRPQLERAACECYAQISRRFKALYSSPAAA